MLKRSWATILAEIKNIIEFLKKVVFRILHLAEDTDIEGTVKGINSGVVLGGSKLWILICSVFIACIGLDVNSPAVIIGAMLISPLMSPILGIGLSLGINDRPNLSKSILNFALATVLSLLTSFLYFKITPFGNFTDEMQARITPTILDAFVALFGGLAGIIAGSRTEKTNAIPGVAIATALMPPLCTAGFGLATGRFAVFGGAFYLFFINAVLISLSTYFIVRLLKFPHVKLMDPDAERRTKFALYFFLTLLLIPSVVFLIQTVQNATRLNTITQFIEQNIHSDIDKGVEWTFRPNKEETDELRVYYFGQYIDPDSVHTLEKKFNGMMNDRFFSKISSTEFANSLPFFIKNLLPSQPHECIIALTPTDAPPDEEKKQMLIEVDRLKTRLSGVEQYQFNDVKKFTSETDSLKEVIVQLKGDTIPFTEIQREVGVLYPELEEFSISKAQQTNFENVRLHNQYIAVIKWQKNTYRNTRRRYEIRLKDYLKIKLNTDTVGVVSF